MARMTTNRKEGTGMGAREYVIVLDATGDDYGSDPDTYVVLYGDVADGREVVASCFETIAEAQTWIDRYGIGAPFHMSSDEAMPRDGS